MKKHPATAKKYSVVSTRVGLSGPSFSRGLKSPVASPKYVTREVTAREKITTFRMRMSFVGAKLKPSEARAQAKDNSNSCDSHKDVSFVTRFDLRRLMANHRLTM